MSRFDGDLKWIVNKYTQKCMRLHHSARVVISNGTSECLVSCLPLFYDADSSSNVGYWSHSFAASIQLQSNRSANNSLYVSICFISHAKYSFLDFIHIEHQREEKLPLSRHHHPSSLPLSRRQNLRYSTKTAFDNGKLCQTTFFLSIHR